MNIAFKDYVRLEIPDGKVKKITDDSGNVLWMAGYVNQVPVSTDADGAVYNGTGYKYGYRLRSGGAEAAAELAVHTGYIPVSGGDVVRVSGYDFLRAINQNAINVSDASFTNIGQIVGNYAAAGYGIFAEQSGDYSAYSFDTIEEESEGVFKWIAPPAESGIAYIRVTSVTTYNDNANMDYTGERLIVTVNEEIV